MYLIHPTVSQNIYINSLHLSRGSVLPSISDGVRWWRRRWSTHRWWRECHSFIQQWWRFILGWIRRRLCTTKWLRWVLLLWRIMMLWAIIHSWLRWGKLHLHLWGICRLWGICWLLRVPMVSRWWKWRWKWWWLCCCTHRSSPCKHSGVHRRGWLWWYRRGHHALLSWVPSVWLSISDCHGYMWWWGHRCCSSSCFWFSNWKWNNKRNVFTFKTELFI